MTDQPTHRGKLISFEGLPGSGKSTLAKVVGQRLESAGWTAVCLPDLAKTQQSRLLDELLQLFSFTDDKFHRSGNGIFDAFIANAIRCELVEQLIRPSIERHDFVLEDRGANTMISYGIASIMESSKGIKIDEVAEWLRGLIRWAGPESDLVILLRTSIAVCIERYERRSGKAVTLDEQSYLCGVDRAYSYLANTDGSFCVIEVEDKTPEQLADDAMACISHKFQQRLY